MFKTFPRVLSVKTQNAEMARIEHETSEIAVDIWVTRVNRSSVGVRRLPYMSKELW